MALTGKTVVITGATGGIGFATATHYLNGGIKVNLNSEQQQNHIKNELVTNFDHAHFRIWLF